MSCILIAIAVIFIVSSPPSLSLDLVPADDVAEYDYVADDQVPFAEQPGKQNLLEHNISPNSLLSYSCIRNALLLFCLHLFRCIA